MHMTMLEIINSDRACFHSLGDGALSQLATKTPENIFLSGKTRSIAPDAPRFLFIVHAKISRCLISFPARNYRRPKSCAFHYQLIWATRGETWQMKQ